MLSHHSIITCQGCGAILTRCRCPGPHSVVPKGYCEECKKKLGSAHPTPVAPTSSPAPAPVEYVPDPVNDGPHYRPAQAPGVCRHGNLPETCYSCGAECYAQAPAAGPGDMWMFSFKPDGETPWFVCSGTYEEMLALYRQRQPHWTDIFLSRIELGPTDMDSDPAPALPKGSPAGLREAVDLQTLIDDMVSACQYIEANENTASYSKQTPGKILYSRLLGHIGELRAVLDAAPRPQEDAQ